MCLPYEKEKKKKVSLRLALQTFEDTNEECCFEIHFRAFIKITCKTLSSLCESELELVLKFLEKAIGIKKKFAS